MDLVASYTDDNSNNSPKVEAQTGICIPRYLNEVTVDLRDFAHREFNRKKIAQQFNEKKDDSRMREFQTACYIPGENDQTNEKFNRLLGGKKRVQKLQEVKQDQEMLKQLEEKSQKSMAITQDLMSQYDQSRTQTHMARGVGLGYTSTLYQPLG